MNKNQANQIEQIDFSDNTKIEENPRATNRFEQIKETFVECLQNLRESVSEKLNIGTYQESRASDNVQKLDLGGYSGSRLEGIVENVKNAEAYQAAEKTSTNTGKFVFKNWKQVLASGLLTGSMNSFNSENANAKTWESPASVHFSVPIKPDQAAPENGQRFSQYTDTITGKKTFGNFRFNSAKGILYVVKASKIGTKSIEKGEFVNDKFNFSTAKFLNPGDTTPYYFDHRGRINAKPGTIFQKTLDGNLRIIKKEDLDNPTFPEAINKDKAKTEDTPHESTQTKPKPPFVGVKKSKIAPKPPFVGADENVRITGDNRISGLTSMINTLPLATFQVVPKNGIEKPKELYPETKKAIIETIKSQNGKMSLFDLAMVINKSVNPKGNFTSDQAIDFVKNNRSNLMIIRSQYALSESKRNLSILNVNLNSIITNAQKIPQLPQKQDSGIYYWSLALSSLGLVGAGLAAKFGLDAKASAEREIDLTTRLQQLSIENKQLSDNVQKLQDQLKAVKKDLADLKNASTIKIKSPINPPNPETNL